MTPETARFKSLLERMTRAICAGDGAAAAACFTPDGVYHDGFYGSFRGRDEIARMVGIFHRDGAGFTWAVSDALADAEQGYLRYEFTYASKIAGSEGRPVRFSGTTHCRLKDGLIVHYGEQFERAPVLAQLGFADERILKSVKKWGAAP